MTIRKPHLLLVAGTGRNSGKTTLVCDVIRNVSRTHKITAIKITPHFHPQDHNGKVIAEEDGLFIMEEKQKESRKDSSLMLQAGADNVYFAMAEEGKILKAFQIIEKLVPEDRPVVCESGGLRNFMEPGLFLVMNRSDRTELKTDSLALKLMAHQWITFDGAILDFDPGTISYAANKWIIASKH
jgi:hypothetical protein